MGLIMGAIYWAISWVMLRWHSLWALILPGGQFLATNWDWILSIVFLVITVRAVLFPVFVKQIKSQRAMQALAPQMKVLQEKYKNDKETLQREMMDLYKREKANPLMGCLPLLIQGPIFLALYHVLRHLKPTMPPQYQTLYGWTAAQFESASHAKLFGAPISASFRSPATDLAPLGATGTNVKIVAAVLVVIMIVTTFMTSRQMILKTGWAEDRQQRLMQQIMLYGLPAMLLFSGAVFPIGVVIYWVTTNLFSFGQQYWVLHKYPPPPASASGPLFGGLGGPRGGPSGGPRGGPSGGPRGTGGARSGGGARGAGGPRGAGGATGKDTVRGKGAPAGTRGPAGASGDRRSGRGSDGGAGGTSGGDGTPPGAGGGPLAPRPGAKPVNPKKKRRGGGTKH